MAGQRQVDDVGTANAEGMDAAPSKGRSSLAYIVRHLPCINTANAEGGEDEVAGHLNFREHDQGRVVHPELRADREFATDLASSSLGINFYKLF
jgi:hypothetical protein